jgi:hypothetical protein
MEKKDIVDRVFDALCGLTEYHGSSGGWTSRVISESSKPLVKQALLKVFNECHDDEVGELKAKVYAYEKIIANSNFAPILDNKKEKDDIMDCEV